MTDTFMPPAPLQTAVLFLVFNRPDTTAQVFEAIRKAKPPRLYVAADGPRANRDGELQKVAKVREIATAVDWPCEVKTLFREENLGCKYAVSGGITWFFEHEEQGIILEDDCLPSQSFFWFCEALLRKHQNNQNIWIISGYNHFSGRLEEDYYLCKQPGIWGWATWRDRWEKYSPNPNFSASDTLDLPTTKMSSHWKNVFRSSSNIDTWDYQLAHLIMHNFGFCLRSSLNLIENIGFGPNATHTTNRRGRQVKNNEILAVTDLSCSSLFDSVSEDYFHWNNRFKKKTIMLFIGSLRNLARAIFPR